MVQVRGLLSFPTLRAGHAFAEESHPFDITTILPRPLRVAVSTGKRPLKSGFG